MLHVPPTNSLLLTAKQEPYKKAYLLAKILKNFPEKVQKKGPAGEEDKTERVTGLGRRTREEIAKWNQMTALRFQTGGRLWGPPINKHTYLINIIKQNLLEYSCLVQCT